ncbi:hypothetical protein JZO76_02360 [Enterococcus sp. MJM12]|uniref:Uncharacterized protein n=1 Tax=Candidatus Enterococcus myersii TaxID=2815322 RepID=A0ABS3H4N4_9ENTE|nr:MULTISPECIES: hypothetical protein [Enterococcus]MBO0448369.1 hypothetical protein [Enterococcus sp. MJM12]MCD1024301.1 hypothetical protein [Enterococcus sp. SMC-9]MDT2739769.1 hypothetical protein [Enterococcus canintestini]WHA09072.1 hypothetical protein P3T75_12460 [Enterococcus montenegrensis]
MPEMVYVHIDTTSNAILARGITPADFVHGIVHYPSNLLLLDPSSNYGEFEAHTGMKIIRGNESVDRFFDEVRKGRITEDLKWIDFSDAAMLKELTPLEISELLYFGHMKTHLHSPFFYKLQNNFVFFDLKDGLTRIYYRYLDEFYRILADKITRVALGKLNDRRSFFRKATPVEKLDLNLLKEMKGLFQEGVIFCLKSSEVVNKEFHIPIYLVEESGLRQSVTFGYDKPEMLVATLIYSKAERNWYLKHEDNDLLLMPN